MTTQKSHKFEKILNELKERLSAQKQEFLRQVESPVGNTSYNDIVTASLQPETVGVSEGDEELAVGLYDNVETTLAEVTAALGRVESGKFGLCTRCGKKIADARLKAIPYARQCMACERAASNS
jgi:RNA polymerase-binding transcription factor DksA